MCGKGSPLGGLACWAFSRTAFPLVEKLTQSLARSPWKSSQNAGFSKVCLFLPQRICERNAIAFDSLPAALEKHYHHFHAHIFIGAVGIAVRALAPLLLHKSLDPPCVVIDSEGHYVISLLSGHFGANHLARHLALLIGAESVITTSSDATKGPALDLCLAKNHLTILDWKSLPPLQGRFLEGEMVRIWDPLDALLDETYASHFMRARENEADLVIHWKAQEEKKSRMRVAIPCLSLGIGCKKNISPLLLRDAFFSLCQKYSLEPRAFRALATIDEKKEEEAICTLSRTLSLPLMLFSADALSHVQTPNPSPMAGKRFHKEAFSVCEAAALLSLHDSKPFLLVQKESYAQSCSLAVAIPKRWGKNETFRSPDCMQTRSMV